MLTIMIINNIDINITAFSTHIYSVQQEWLLNIKMTHLSELKSLKICKIIRLFNKRLNNSVSF